MHGRNITDDQIHACAKTGGVIGVTGLGRFLPDRASPTIALADCVTYVRDLVGADHVGLGLDELTLLTTDADFTLVARHCSLRVWSPAV